MAERDAIRPSGSLCVFPACSLGRSFSRCCGDKENDPWRSRRQSELESSSLSARKARSLRHASSLPNPNFNHDLSIRSVPFIVVFVSLTQICPFCVMQVPPRCVLCDQRTIWRNLAVYLICFLHSGVSRLVFSSPLGFCLRPSLGIVSFRTFRKLCFVIF